MHVVRLQRMVYDGEELTEILFSLIEGLVQIRLKGLLLGFNFRNGDVARGCGRFLGDGLGR